MQIAICVGTVTPCANMLASNMMLLAADSLRKKSAARISVSNVLTFAQFGTIECPQNVLCFLLMNSESSYIDEKVIKDSFLPS